MSILELPQQTIRVDVSFYNEEEKEKLSHYPSGEMMQKIVSEGIEIPTAEFLTYYLFYLKKTGALNFNSYTSLGRYLDRAIMELDGLIKFNGHSISTVPGVDHQVKGISEHIGESVGLAVANRIHELTEADWGVIPEKGGRGAPPNFDYQIASDGRAFIQLENKGSSVSDNRELSDAIYGQKLKIIKKKEKLNELSRQGMDEFPGSLRYGTISAVDPRRDGNVKCWLVDPPPDIIEENPRRFKLLRRMNFLLEWISIVSPRSQLASALATRIADMKVLPDPFRLNGIPLRNSNNKPFEFAPMGRYFNHTTFLSTKSRVTDGPAGGVVVQLSESALFLIGIREEFASMAANQNFEEIENYKTHTGSINKTVDCVFGQGRFNSLRLPESLKNRVRKSGGYFSFRLNGLLHYSQSGLVFGVLPLSEENF